MSAQFANVQFTEDESWVASRLAAADLYFYTRWMFLARRNYKWLPNWHHEVICGALMKVFRGEILNLIITLPPRYSKTELAVVNFVSWALGQVPDAEFIYTGYSGSLVETYSSETRDLISHEMYNEIFPDVLLSASSSAKAKWRTTLGGALYSVGIGGSTTGMGAGKPRHGFGGAIIIDDPHKADEARSDLKRGGVIEWYQNTLQSRVNSPRTPKILIMQRLHEDDLAGWLLGGGSGEAWTHVCLPALAEHDEEHRRAGEALWEAKHTREKLEQMREAMPYMFAGQYQQRPSPPAGNIFRPDNITIEEAEPTGITWLTGWDFAGTAPSPGVRPDWTAGVKVGLSQDNPPRVWIGDVTRMQGTPDKVQSCLLNTSQRHGRGCRISIPQDPGQAGKAQVLALTKLLQGFSVSSSPESGDKITRAEPFAAQVNVGNVSMVKAEWNDKFINELRNFPNGANDDQVDASSRAYNELVARGRPIVVPKSLLRRI